MRSGLFSFNLTWISLELFFSKRIFIYIMTPKVAMGVLGAAILGYGI